MPEPDAVRPEPPPLPTRRIMSQRWEDVAFLHWRADPDLVGPLLPPGTVPDVFDGSTWVGLIPFRMVGAGMGGGPAVPWLGTFAETNVRLYAVDATGRRGVVFRSLDASRLAVVVGARLVFGLPYHWARMRVLHRDGTVEYASARRLSGGGRRVATRLVVRPGMLAVRDDPLADFLTARWGLHSRWLGRSLFVPNQHERWPLVRAELLSIDDGLVAAAGLPGASERPPDSVLWSPGVRTEFGMPSRMTGGTRPGGGR